MGGSVAIVLAHRRPDLVSRLVLTEANLHPQQMPATTGSGLSAAATMRLTDPRALHRSATGLVRGTEPTMRRLLEGLTVDRVYLLGEKSHPLSGVEDLEAAGVRVVTVPGAGRNIMFDSPDAFAAEVAAKA